MKFLHKIRIKMLALLSPEPEIKEDYVDKVVMLLRRDFNTTTQNEIVLDIVKKLSDLREQDMRKKEEEYQILQRDNNTLKSKIAIT